MEIYASCLFAFATAELMLLTIYSVLDTSKKEKLLTVPLSIGWGLIFYLLNFSGFFSKFFSVNSIQTLKTVFILLYLLLCTLRIKAPLKAKLRTYCIIFLSAFFAEAIIATIYLFGFNLSPMETAHADFWQKSIGYSLNYLLYIIACMVSSYILLRKKSSNTFAKTVPLFGVVLFIFCFISSLVITSNAESKSLFSKVSIGITLALSVVLFITLYYIYTYTNKQERIKEQFLWLQKMQSAEADYYAELQNKTEEIRQMRHDIKDQLFSVKALLNENSTQSICAAEKIVANLETKLGSTALPIYTENRIANTVLAAKLKAAAQADISTDVSVHIPQGLERIDAADLSCVLINLLNNALEACADLPADMPKHLVCKAGVKGNYLIIKVRNPYDKIDIGKNGKFKTTKADAQNHGLGLLLLENIAEKYDGALQIDTADRQFTATVSLKISE